jgi:hypothetical protein
VFGRFNSLLSEASDRNAAAAAAAAAASGTAEIFYNDGFEGACNHTEWISQANIQASILKSQISKYQTSNLKLLTRSAYPSPIPTPRHGAL